VRLASRARVAVDLVAVVALFADAPVHPDDVDAAFRREVDVHAGDLGIAEAVSEAGIDFEQRDFGRGLDADVEDAVGAIQAR
jgi:hypothetical protein